ARAAAHELHHRPTEAHALFLLGKANNCVGNRSLAEHSYYKGALAAQAAGMDELSARAWVAMVMLSSFQNSQFLPPERWSESANAAIERLGGNEQLEASNAHALGAAYWKRGEYEAAMEQVQKGLRITEHSHNLEATRAGLLIVQGIILMRQGKFQESAPNFQEAMEIQSRVWGPNHAE